MWVHCTSITTTVQPAVTPSPAPDPHHRRCRQHRHKLLTHSSPVLSNSLGPVRSIANDYYYSCSVRLCQRYSRFDMDFESVAAPSAASASGADVHGDATTSATGNQVNVKQKTKPIVKKEPLKVILKSKARPKPKQEMLRTPLLNVVDKSGSLGKSQHDQPRPKTRPRPPRTTPPPQNDDPMLKKGPRPPSTPPPPVVLKRAAAIGSRDFARCTGLKHDGGDLQLPGSARNQQATEVRDKTTRSHYVDANTIYALDSVGENQKSMAESTALGSEKRDTYRALAAAQRLPAKEAGNTSKDSHRLWLDKKYKKRNEKRWQHAAQS